MCHAPLFGDPSAYGVRMLELTDVRIVAGFLVSGFGVFLTGASLWKPDYERPLPEALEVIASSPERWRWIHLWMVGGIIVTLLGLGGLTQLFLVAGGLFTAPLASCFSPPEH